MRMNGTTEKLEGNFVFRFLARMIESFLPNLIFSVSFSPWLPLAASAMALRLRRLQFENPNPDPDNKGARRTIDLGSGSEVVYVPRFLRTDQSWEWLDYLDKVIPWTRPTIHVFGRACLQPRDTCYVADKGIQQLQYSGYQPHAHSWDDFPPLKAILMEVHAALPGSAFNSLLLNRYKSGSDYVAWHSDDEKLYGPTPEIASVSFGCEREFLLRKRPNKTCQVHPTANPKSTSHKPLKTDRPDQHSFILKHGSLLVMRGRTQRDWVHSVPKRSKANTVRINLTFRRVLS